MNIKRVLELFAALPENEKAHVMCTLLDFRNQRLDEFERKYGTISREYIDKILEVE